MPTMQHRYVSLLLLIVAVRVTTTNAANSEDMRKAAVDNSAKILQDLYNTLRNILSPKSPFSNGKVANRFVLMSPGKVLNYLDYFPGHEYEESLLRKNNSAPETLIPPSVMEKWFDIADVMVGGDPFNGGTTGKSLANVYHTIVSQMEVLDIKKTSQAAQSRYNEAYNFLTAQIPDPGDLTRNMTRLSVYSFYQDQYSQRRLEMEDKIDEARRTRGSIDYELWFQRHYPALNNRVEAAYTEWLVFGQKEMVELYKAYVDTASAGAEVEDAKMALRASGVQSLDRTRTIYPVSFEPGNWYKYLLPKVTGPSRDMLLALKSTLISEKDALTTMIEFNLQNQHQRQRQESLKKIQQRVNATNANQRNKTTAAMATRVDCMSHNSDHSDETVTESDSSDPCQKLKTAAEDAVGATFQHAQTQSEYFSASLFLGSPTKYNRFLRTRIEAVERQLEHVNEQLESTTPYLGDIADSREFRDLDKILNNTEQNLDVEWEQFEYDSDSSHLSTDIHTSSVNVGIGFGVGVPGEFSVGGSFNFGRTKGDIEKAVNRASLKVSGQVLRVIIKRPWFKPSIFENPLFFFIQHNSREQKKTFVSPGLSLTEAQFRDAVNGAGADGNLYLLPEYVTSFVLARDVKLQFSGLDSKTSNHFMHMTVGASLSGSYDMFSLSASFGIGKTKQTVTADRTANGIKIKIPGAQIIGYYTQVLPQFPRV